MRIKSNKIRFRICKSCGGKFQVNPYKPLIPVCGITCAIAYQKLLKEKKEEKELSDKIDEMEVKCTNWRKKLQNKVQEIIKYIDRGLPCLARGNYPKKYNAGHIYARGGNSSMALNLHNIHRQSAQSNHFQNDDGLLREGLTKEYGQPYMTFISELRRTPQLKYSNEDYHQFYLKACEIANPLKKLNFTYGLKTRIIMRNIINSELGIYENEFCNFTQLKK